MLSRTLKIIVLCALTNISLMGFSFLPSEGSVINAAEGTVKKSINGKINSLIGNIKLSKLLGLNTNDIINANLINIPGFLGIGFKCGLKGSIPTFNICKLINKNGGSSNFNLSLGPCKLQVGLSDKCVTELAEKMCEEKEQNVVTPLKTMNAAAKNLATTGNLYIKQHAWNNSCANLFGSEKDQIIKNANGVSLANIRNTFFTPQTVYKYALPSTGATNIFDPRLREWKNCIFLNAKNGSYEEAIKKCSELKNETMPMTEEKVKEEIQDAIPFLMNNTDDIMDNDYKNIYTYKALYLKNCSNSPDPKQCEENIWNNGFNMPDGSVLKPKDIYKKQLQDTEKANARFAAIVKKADAKQKEIIFESQSFINTLPPTEQKKYEFLAKRAMYREILDKYFLKKITDLEEEAISINYDAEKVAASPFYPQQALQEIDQMIAAFASNGGGGTTNGGTSVLGKFTAMPKISIPHLGF